MYFPEIHMKNLQKSVDNSLDLCYNDNVERDKSPETEREEYTMSNFHQELMRFRTTVLILRQLTAEKKEFTGADYKATCATIPTCYDPYSVKWLQEHHYIEVIRQEPVQLARDSEGLCFPNGAFIPHYNKREWEQGFRFSELQEKIENMFGGRPSYGPGKEKVDAFRYVYRLNLAKIFEIHNCLMDTANVMTDL